MNEDDDGLLQLQDPNILDRGTGEKPGFEETSKDKSEIKKCYLFSYVVTILLGFMQFGWQQGNWNVI